jgi:hypothetical protein
MIVDRPGTFSAARMSADFTCAEATCSRRALQRRRQKPPFACLRHRAEQRQRVEHAAHGPAPKRLVAGEDCRDRGRGDRTHGEPHAGSGIPEIEHIGGFCKTADAHAVYAPTPHAVMGDSGPKRAHGVRSVEDIFGF